MSKEDRSSLLSEYWSAPGEALFREEVPAARMDVVVATLQRDRWIGKGIPFVKIGKLVRYRKSDIEAYIAKQQTVKSTSEVQAI